jgi:chemotaxis protein methyltransferase CheR
MTAAAWLPPLAALVGERLGLDFPPERWADLERGIRLAAQQAGAADVDTFARDQLAAGPDERRLAVLAEALTVGETYFFRERRSFEVLEQQILPSIIAARRSAEPWLRLWSAGCCTGEEAYSLAIVVDRLLPRRQEGQVTILATDVNPGFLRSAARGEFGDWSFRDAPPGFRERYFSPAPAAAGAPRRWLVDARIRRMVRFAPLNLVQPLFPDWRSDTQAMDLILCRNVLMYFSPHQMQRVLGRLQRSLAEGGWLAVSAAEAAVKTLHALTPVPFEGAMFYRKSDAAGGTPGSGGASDPQAQYTAPSPAWTPAAVVAGAGRAAALSPDARPAPATFAAPMPRGDEVVPAAEFPHGSTSTPGPVGPAAAAADAASHVNPLHLARRQADAGQLALARATVEQALVQRKLDPAAHHLHAMILQELGQPGEARRAFQRAIYLAPDFVLAHHALGQLARSQGQATQAQRHFEDALALLAGLQADALLPQSDGLCAGHLRALIEATLQRQRRSA